MRYRSYRGFNLDPIWVIIVINVAVFIAAFLLDIVSPMYNPLTHLFALQGVNLQYQPWTILTSLFTHEEPWHLIFNMLTFYFFGTYLISLVGNIRFLIVYFGGGIAGNILFVLLQPFYPVIGASGAIFALGGALALLRPSQRVYVFPIPAPVPLWAAVFGGFLLLFVVSPFLRVAWQAHLGGLVFGVIAGYFFRRSRF